MSYRAMPYIVDSFANQPSSRSRGTTAVERLRRARKSLNSYNVKRQRIGEEAECSCTNSRARFQLNPDDVSRTLGAKLPPARSSEATAAAALRTHDDVCSALPAAGYTDRVFEALHAVSGAEGSLDGRLTDVGRKNLSCCRRTIHIESRPVQSCLNCHSLLALDHLLLCLASRRQHGQNYQRYVFLFHK